MVALWSFKGYVNQKTAGQAGQSACVYGCWPLALACSRRLREKNLQELLHIGTRTPVHCTSNSYCAIFFWGLEKKEFCQPQTLYDGILS